MNSVYCPHCHHKMQVPESYMTSAVKCNSCRSEYTPDNAPKYLVSNKSHERERPEKNSHNKKSSVTSKLSQGQTVALITIASILALVWASEYLEGKLIISLVKYAAIGSLFGAIFVRVATKLAAGFTPRYGTAYLAAFLGCAASLIREIVIGAPSRVFDVDFITSSMIIWFFVQTAVHALLIKHPDTGNITYGTACIISLIQLIIGVTIIGFIIFIGFRL